MAITTAMCTSFKQELLGGTHDLDTDSIKLALIKASPAGTYGAATTNYKDLISLTPAPRSMAKGNMTKKKGK